MIPAFNNMTAVTIMLPAVPADMSRLYTPAGGSAKIITVNDEVFIFLLLSAVQPSTGAIIIYQNVEYIVQNIRTCYNYDGSILCYRCHAAKD
jgi:hypothetical protein